jgi:hypothetical protein
MRAKHYVMSVIVIVGIQLIVGCGQVRNNAASAAAQQTTPTAAGGVVSNTNGAVMPSVTPIPDKERTAQPTGQSEPGAAATSEGVIEAPEERAQQPAPGTGNVYADTTYKFSVAYPKDFAFHSQPAEKLAALEPKPAAAFVFMNPVSAASDVAEFEPADLEIRTYTAGQSPSLGAWLALNSLVPADGSEPGKPFRKAHVSGIEVCASTMIAPGCSYFVQGSEWVYQLIPATVEGQAMLDTFMLVP